MRIVSCIQEVSERTKELITLFDVEVPSEYDLSVELRHELIDQQVEDHRILGKCFCANGLVLIDHKIQTSVPILTTFECDTDVIVMDFILSGERRLWDKRSNETSKLIAERTHNLMLLKKGTYHSIKKGMQEHDQFVVVLSVPFFLRLIDQSLRMHTDFVSAVFSGKEIQLASDFLGMSQEMRTLIGNVRNCSRKGSFHRLCLEIKITELLMLQYEQLYLLQEKGDSRNDQIDSDTERLENARNILETDYQDPPTIKQLALKVGMNEFALKSKFKKVYLSTIHSYVVKVRMQKASLLIRQKNVLVKEVALEVGYQNPSHFSAAFKEFYGFGPSELI